MTHKVIENNPKDAVRDINRLGDYIFIGDIDRLNNLDDLYWSYVEEFTSEYNGNCPYTQKGTRESELEYLKRNMKFASFNKVGLWKMLAKADQRAKERMSKL